MLNTAVVSFYDNFGLILKVPKIWRSKLLKIAGSGHPTVV